MAVENTSEEYLSHIRQKVAIETHLKRIEKRTTCFNARRNNFEEIAKRIKEPNIDEFQVLCHRFRHNKKLCDLEKIHQQLASGQPQFIKVFLETEGTTYSLMGCLSGSNTKLQLQAIYCIINIGFGTEEQCMKVCKRAGSYLITCLGSNNPQIQGLCCWAFGNLCGTFPKVCSLILSQGFEEAISRVVSSPSPYVVQWSCYAINHYLNTSPSRIQNLCKPMIIKQLLASLSLNEEYIADGCWCLFTVSTVSELCSVLVNFGVVSIVLDVLFNLAERNVLAVEICTPFVRLLSNCLAVLNEIAVEMCYQIDKFVSIVKFLLQSPYNHLQKETLQLVANLVNGASVLPVTGEKLMEDSNLKRKLEPLLKQTLASQFSQFQPPNYDFVSTQNDSNVNAGCVTFFSSNKGQLEELT